MTITRVAEPINGFRITGRAASGRGQPFSLKDTPGLTEGEADGIIKGVYNIGFYRIYYQYRINGKFKK